MMKNKLVFIILLLINFNRLSAQLIGTYTIGPSSTYKTFNQAVNALKTQGIGGFVTFNVEPGVYNEQVTIPVLNTGPAGMILFQSQNLDSSSVILKYKPKNDSANFTLCLNGANYIWFREITISTDTITGKSILFTNGCNHNEFLNDRIMGLYQGKELVYNNDTISAYNNYNTFKQNSFINGSTGISLSGDTANSEQSNLITQNSFINQYESAVSLQYETYFKITGNTIISNSGLASFFGININYCGDSFQISKNKLSLTNAEVNSIGINIHSSSGKASSHNLIYDNFIYINANDFAYGIMNISSNMDYFYNSINFTGPCNGSVDMGAIAGMNVRIIDNIFANDSQGYALMISDTAGLISDYNNLFTTGPAVASWSMFDYPTLDSFRDDTKLDLHSVSVNPGFYTASDLHTNSPLFDNKGKPVAGVKDDIDGKIRSTKTPDIGAVEFTGKFDLGPDIVLCGNDSAVLDAGAGFDTYLWTGNYKSQKITVSEKYSGTGTFKIKVIATYGAEIFRDSINVTIANQPVLNLVPDMNICKNSNAVIIAPAGFKYKWSTGGTTDTTIVFVKDTTKVWLVISNAQGCKAGDTIMLNPVVVPIVNLGHDTALCANQSLLLNAGKGYDSYKWFNDSTSSTLKVDTNGRGSGNFKFWVIASKNGCSTRDSIYITFKICTSVNDISQPEISVYPNPSSGKLYLLLSADFINSEYQITDLTGNTRLQGIINRENIYLDTRNMEDGIYFVIIRTKEKNVIKKIIISK